MTAAGVRSVQAVATSTVLAVALGLAGLLRPAATGLLGGRLGAVDAVVTACVALVVLLVAVGWGSLFDLPDRPGVVAVLTLTGLGTLAAVVWRGHDRDPLGVLAAAVATALMLAFARELLRRDGRPQLVESVTGTLSGQVVTVLSVGWVLLPRLSQGRECLVLAAGVTAAAALGDGVGSLRVVPSSRRPWVGGLVGLLAAVVAAVLLTRSSQPSLLMPALVLVPLAAGVVSGLGALLTPPPGPGARWTALVAGSAARVGVMGAVAYAVLRVVAGA